MIFDCAAYEAQVKAAGRESYTAQMMVEGRSVEKNT